MVVAQLVLSAVGSTSVAADFAANFGGTTGANFNQAAYTFDAAGNVYLVGTFTDVSMTVGAVTITKIGVMDVVVIKTDASGAVIWAKNFGGSGASAYGNSIAVDASGNVYLGGHFTNANLTSPALTKIGEGSAFAFKLDSAGTSVWARSFGGSGAFAYGQAIAVDASSNVYLGGNFDGASLFRPALTKIGNVDAFAIKLDSAGTIAWSKNFGGVGATAFGRSIAVDASGNLYLGGYFQNANLTTPALTKVGSADAFAFMLDSAGTSVWSRNFGGVGARGIGQSIAVDTSGNVYLGGFFDIANLTTPALTKIGNTDAFAFKLDSVGTSVWARNFGGIGSSGEVRSIAVDASGNVYLGGNFSNANLTTPVLTSIGYRDAFAFKLDSAGASVWARNFGGSGAFTNGQSIAVDTPGNVFFGGNFQGNLTTPALSRIGILDAFTLKLDSAGSTTLAKAVYSLAPGGTIVVSATAVDVNGDTYLAGYFDGVTVSLGGITLTRIGNNDIFVAKLNAAGAVLWAKNFGGLGAYAQGQSVAVDASGNVYLGGFVHSTNLTTPALTKIGGTDAFAFKLNNAGTIVWARNFGGSGAFAQGLSIAVDAPGNVYLGGYVHSADLTTPALTKLGMSDAFAFKLDSAGTTLWSRNFGGSGADARGQSIAVDASGNVYLGGYFQSANLTIPALTSIGFKDAFAFKLDSAGSIVWSRNFGGSGAGAQAQGIAVDASGNVYLGGYFTNANLTRPILTKIGASDAFAFKLNSVGTSVWAKNFGGWAFAYGQSIAVDASGKVYLGGHFNGGNLTNPALTKIGNSDAFALMLDIVGTSVWSRNFGGSGVDTFGHSIAIGSGYVYLGGHFNNANLTTPALSKIGFRDAFIIKRLAVKGGAPIIFYLLDD